VEHRKADIKLEVMSNSAALFQDPVLQGPVGTFSLAVLLSSTVELIEDWVGVVVADGVYWGTRCHTSSR
jgi:hypothetical protein